jgi:hypothetical protein
LRHPPSNERPPVAQAFLPAVSQAFLPAVSPTFFSAHARCRFILAFLSALGFLPLHSHATPDLRFDVVTFCCICTNSGSFMCQTQFDHMNFPTVNGHYIAMGNDTHRADLLANHNLLAVYFNTLNDGWTTNSGAVSAAAINQYATNLFTSTGPRPDWVVLNEISSGTWPGNSSYRTWVRDVAHTLHTVYGFSVILYSPFPNPGANDADWQAVSADAYIAVENYLSGEEIQAQNFSVSWCQSQYQSSINSHNARGVPTTRLLLGEHYAQTLAGSGYGRSGASSNAWDQALIARSTAARNLPYAGFIGYAWDKDGMNVSGDEMIHFEDTYATNPFPALQAVSAPYIISQPQSLIIAPGGTAAFNVVPAGIAPVTYQWRLNGLALAGATESSLTVTNVGPADAGNYSVLLTNAAGWTLSSNALLQVQIPPPLSTEPFADATASGGTAYSPGTPLIGQTNAQNLTWFQAGPASGLANQPMVRAGSLAIPGLASSTGNSVAFGGSDGMAARFEVYPLGSGATTGTIYYCCALMLTDITGLNGSGVFWAGFNNSNGSQTTTPTVIATRLYARAAGAGYNLGLSKASSSSTDWQWDTTVHAVNEIVFVVGSYTFNSGSTNDDVAKLWINPAPSSFGAGAPPPPTLTTASGPDITAAIIRTFLIMNRDPTEPAVGVMDELRFGTAWASVTPPAITPPALQISQTAQGLTLSWSTNALGFNLESTSAVAPLPTWSPTPWPVFIIGDQYTVTNIPPSDAAAYFRLHHP